MYIYTYYIYICTHNGMYKLFIDIYIHRDVHID